MIELGSKVRDTISGLVGIVTVRKEFLNGCIQYTVEPKMKKGGTEIPCWNIDDQQLEVLCGPDGEKIKKKKKSLGGPMTKALSNKELL